jgi:chemotaxis regulatin CheY-phosphate phosphatase CheZ
MQVYKDRFEDTDNVNQRELWKYLAQKIAQGGENIFKAKEYARPARENIESEELENLQNELQKIMDDPSAPPDEQKQAEMFLNTIKLKPLQEKIRG